ncbi:hypothetical protein [Aquabacter cavernae]|uniref:hypothetical protein n=1 Tax=Aquabacter cavernae TaxID=2496029 RepID=UPI000F8DE6B0|nr:hypothetical protein [Aquabacter cavernae]
MTLFTNSDFVRRAQFFDIDARSLPGMLALPEAWTFVPGDERRGFFIAVADLSADGRAGALRALAIQTRLLLLQVATSKYVGVRIGERRFLVEIDPRALTHDAVAHCLTHAGLPAAQERLDGASTPAPREAVNLCVTLANHADALAALVATFGRERQAALTRAVRFPTRERLDCFLPQELDTADIGRSTLAAGDAAGFDYLAFTAAAAEIPLPTPVYVKLRDDWGARNLPSLAEAEAEAGKVERLTSMRKVYYQYSRVLACAVSLKQVRLEAVDEPRMGLFKSTITTLERRMRTEVDLDVLWDESTRDYPRMLGSLRISASSSPTHTMYMCADEVAKLDTALARLMGATAPQKRDFGPAAISEAMLPERVSAPSQPRQLAAP